MSSGHINGQKATDYFVADSVLPQGDTAQIELNNSVRGTIQWQRSHETDSWEDIEGENETELLQQITDTVFFRAKITEDDCDPIYSEAVRIDIGIAPTAAFTADQTSITAGDSIQFTDESTKDPTSWRWEFGDGSTSSDQNPSYTYSSAGTYTVELTVSSDYGADTLRKTDYITVCPESFTDARDGQTYEVIPIGSQCWMAENLKYLPSVVGPGTISDTDPYYYVYGYDGTNVSEAKSTENYNTYGVLYNWNAFIDGASSSSSNPSGVQGVCPDGWHVPSDEEWKELEMELGMSQSEADNNGNRGTNEGSKLAGNASLWNDGELESNSEFGTSGFRALPGASRHSDIGFIGIEYIGEWWSSAEFFSTNVWDRSIHYDGSDIARNYTTKEHGLSVRCVRDVEGQAPAASFAADKTAITPGSSIQFTDESTTNPTNWSWDFGDGNTSNGQNPSHTYSSEGAYTVELIVSNDYGADTLTKTDYISVGSTPTANFTSDTSNIAEGKKINFEDLSSGAIDTWSWKFGDGNTSNDQNPSHTYSTEGNYTVELIVSNDYGADTLTKTDYIAVGSAPTAEFTSDTANIAEGEMINFEDQSSGAIDTWSWKLGDGNTSSTQNPSHTYSSAGTYTVELTVSNDYGGDTETKTNYITVGRAPTANFTADQTAITPDGSVQFTDESTGNPTTWSWDFGYGSNSNEQNPSHTYSWEGTYTVELIVSNDYGADTLTKTDYITVCPESFTDARDGQTYEVAPIDNQCWMAENLNYDAGGDSWCFNNFSSHCNTYGRLYDWDAVMQGESSSNSNPSGVQGVCPEGWHVPSDEEWKELEMQLGMSQSEAENTGYRGTNEGSKLAGNASLWDDGELESNSEFGSSGFTALPGGRRYDSGPFTDFGAYGYWWSSTEGSFDQPWHRSLDDSHSNVYRSSQYKEYGFSVRCVKVVAEGEAPAASFSADQTTIFEGGSVQFTDESTNSPTTWSWDFGDGNNSSEQNPSHTYSSAGKYTVELIVSNNYGVDTLSKTDYITVDQLPTIDYNGTLYVYPVDNSAGIRWGGYGTEITNGNGADSDTDGEANTSAIVSQLGSDGHAAYLCDTLTAYGYSDWYLPAKEELNALYQNKDAIGGFSSNSYWSSTEYNAYNARYLYFYTGAQGFNDVSNNYRVRCVRRD